MVQRFRFSDPQRFKKLLLQRQRAPTFDGAVLSYIDLDIDILVNPDFTYQVLDLDEFEHHATRYGYSEEVRQNAERAVQDLITMIESRQFPFDGTGWG